MSVVGHPLFLLAIVRSEDGATAVIPGGGKLEADLMELFVSHIMPKIGLGRIDTDLTELIVSRIMSQGVSFRTAKHVEADIRKGLADIVTAQGISCRTGPHLESDIRDGIAEAIMSMKAKTKQIVS